MVQNRFNVYFQWKRFKIEYWRNKKWIILNGNKIDVKNADM